MFQPEELKKDDPLLWSAGNGTEVWDLFCACAAGDLETVQRLLDHNPSLVRSHFEYRTPLYFAVRENQMPVARFLIDRGARPFYNDDLVEMARIRGHADMKALLESHRSSPQPVLSGVQLLMRAFRNRDMSTVSRLTQEFLMPGSSCDIWTAAFVGTGEAGAIQRIADHFQIRRQIAWDRPATSIMAARLRRFVWERLGAPLSVDDRDGLELSEAQLLIARSYGFESWRELEAQAS